MEDELPPEDEKIEEEPEEVEVQAGDAEAVIEESSSEKGENVIKPENPYEQYLTEDELNVSSNDWNLTRSKKDKSDKENDSFDEDEERKEYSK